VPTTAQKFQVGEKVTWLHQYSKPSDIACTTGAVSKVEIKYQGTEREHSIYSVKFDAGIFRHPIYNQVFSLDLTEQSLRAK